MGEGGREGGSGKGGRRRGLEGGRVGGEGPHTYLISPVKAPFSAL